MEYLWALFFVYLFLCVLAFFLSKGRISSPSVIMLFSFCVMFVLALVCYDYFRFEIKVRTFWIMTIAGVAFLVTEQFINLVFIQRNTRKRVIDPTPIVIDKVWIRIILLFTLFTLFFSIYVIMHTSTGSWTTRMYIYKSLMINDSGAIPHRTFLSQIYKIDLAMVHVLGYVTVYNILVCKSKIRDNILNIIIIFVFAVAAFTSQAARQPMMEYIVYLGLIFVLIKERDKEKKDIVKFIIYAIPIVYGLAFLFYKTMTLAGRTMHTGKTVLHYIAEYFCGGLYAFNHHINEPAISTYFGRQSFKELYSFFTKLHLMDSSIVNFQPSFDKYGNTATLYGRWYEDFGTLGVIIMSILVSACFAIAYNKLRIKQSLGRDHLSLIIYSYTVVALVWAGYDDRIKAIISMTMVFKLILIYIFYQILVKKKIRFKMRK